jgi:hypothetical protein
MVRMGRRKQNVCTLDSCKLNEYTSTSSFVFHNSTWLSNTSFIYTASTKQKIILNLNLHFPTSMSSPLPLVYTSPLQDNNLATPITLLTLCIPPIS